MPIYEPKSTMLEERLIEVFWHDIENLKKRKIKNPRWNFDTIEERIRVLFSVMPIDLKEREVYSKVGNHECIWCDRQIHGYIHSRTNYSEPHPMDGGDIISYFTGNGT